jgi:uncharacterized protein (DUF2336 family)
MTTKSTVAQMIVADYARDVSNDPATENDAVTPPEAENDASEGVNAEPLDETTAVSFSSKEAADAARTEFSEYLHDLDDKRMTEVHFSEGTPAEVVAELKRRGDSFTPTS